jgi:hypothetical protein
MYLYNTKQVFILFIVHFLLAFFSFLKNSRHYFYSIVIIISKNIVDVLFKICIVQKIFEKMSHLIYKAAMGRFMTFQEILYICY